MAACGASGAGLDGTLGAGLLGIDGFATGLVGGMGGPRGLLGPGEDGLEGPFSALSARSQSLSTGGGRGVVTVVVVTSPMMFNASLVA